MKNFLKKLILTIIILLIASYLLGTVIYEDRYIPNTYLNGESISNKKETDVEEEITKKMKNYTLSIIKRELPTEVIFGDDIDYKGIIDTKFYDILKNQNKYLWFKNLLIAQNEEINIEYVYDKEKVKERLKKSDLFKEENLVEAEDAYITKSKSGFKIVPETKGTIVDIDKLYNKTIEFIDLEKSSLNLEQEGLYEEANITKDSVALKKQLEKFEEYSKFTITYDFSDRKEVINSNIYGEWISINEFGDLTFDEEQIRTYVKDLANKYDTLGKNVSFNTTNSGEITLKSDSYGWKIDVEKTIIQLREAIENKETITLEPVYTKKAISRSTDIIGNTYIEISLEEQNMWFYKDGKCLVDTPVVTGLPTEARQTEIGLYSLVSRETNRYLGTYEVQGYSSYVNYWMPFNGGQGVHDSTWRDDSEYGGTTYKTKGSHGCVNTPLDKVKIIYENIKTGYPVIVY